MNEFNYDEYKAQRAERMKEFKDAAIKEFPTFDIENDWELVSADVWDAEFISKDGRKRIVVNTLANYSFLTNTLLGHNIEELTEKGEDFTVIDGVLDVTIIEWNNHYAAVRKFWKRDGSHVKGVKLLRDIKENSKGKFITIDRKRVYKGAE